MFLSHVRMSDRQHQKLSAVAKILGFKDARQYKEIIGPSNLKTMCSFLPLLTIQSVVPHSVGCPQLMAEMITLKYLMKIQRIFAKKYGA